jgi:hypothetical protein
MARTPIPPRIMHTPEMPFVFDSSVCFGLRSIQQACGANRPELTLALLACAMVSIKKSYYRFDLNACRDGPPSSKMGSSSGPNPFIFKVLPDKAGRMRNFRGKKSRAGHAFGPACFSTAANRRSDGVSRSVNATCFIIPKSGRRNDTRQRSSQTL